MKKCICKLCSAEFISIGRWAHFCDSCADAEHKRRTLLSNKRLYSTERRRKYPNQNGQMNDNLYPDHAKDMKRSAACSSSDIQYASPEKTVRLIDDIFAGKVVWAGIK